MPLCNKKGEVHHAGGKKIILCRDHHNATHKKRGDGPGSAGGHNESVIRSVVRGILLRDV